MPIGSGSQHRWHSSQCFVAMSSCREWSRGWGNPWRPCGNTGRQLHSELSSSSHLLPEAGISAASWLGSNDVTSCAESWESDIWGLQRQFADYVRVCCTQISGWGLMSVPSCVRRSSRVDLIDWDDVSIAGRSCLPPVHLLLFRAVDIHLRNWEFKQ